MSEKEVGTIAAIVNDIKDIPESALEELSNGKGEDEE